MSHANFKLKLTELDHITANGIDHLELLISVNNKEEYYPITKFSSGGELSRIALAIKSVSANTKSIPVLIFDEIDSGISGKVASEVGLLLKNISKMAQVINITHLPQVAAFGNVHFHVEKNETLNGMSSNLTILNKEERIQVLANMLGGDKTGSAARNNALELLN
jgi:DNA repair protein RecN (Recombination protein N)